MTTVIASPETLSPELLARRAKSRSRQRAFYERHPDYRREYYAANREQIVAEARLYRLRNAATVTQYARSRTRVRQAYIDSLKTSPCTDCGGQFPSYVKDFDHLIAADKKFGLGRALNASFAAIDAEVAKCELVCSNCHRMRTHKRAKCNSR